jgi:ethanolamine permease
MKVAPGNPTSVLNADYSLTRANVFCLGLVMVWGGFYNAWNPALGAGLGGCLVAILLVGSAYFFMCLCIASVSSVIPFSGGGYGLARCSLGFYLGFVVGCCESLQYMIFLSLFANYVSQYTCSLFGCATSEKVLTWVGVLSSSAVLQMYFSARSVNRFVLIMAVVEVAALLVFCLGTLTFVDFREYALILRDLPHQTQMSDVVCASYPVIHRHVWFVGGVDNFLRILPLPAMIYVGVEALSMAASDTQYPKRDVPWAQLLLMPVMFVGSVVVVLLASSMSPGTQCIAFELAPLNPSLLSICNGNRVAVWLLTMPVMYTAPFGFMWAYIKMLRSLTNSSFFPPLQGLGTGLSGNNTALLLGAIPCIVLNICMEFYEQGDMLLNLGLLFALVAYGAQCAGYLLLASGLSVRAVNDSSFKRVGAVFAIMVWILMAIGILGYRDKKHVALMAFVVCLLAVTWYYFLYGKMRQSLSDDEKKYFYALHLLNCKFSQEH